MDRHTEKKSVMRCFVAVILSMATLLILVTFIDPAVAAESGTGELCITEEPVASSIWQGENLKRSRIQLGEVCCNGEPVDGKFEWKNDTIVPELSDSKKTEFEAHFTPSDTKIYGDGLDCTVKVPVYQFSEGERISAFLWRSGAASRDHVPAEIVDEYPDLYEAFSLTTVYNSWDELTNVSAEQAAHQAARALVQMPSGSRAISIDGTLTYLMGGNVRAGDDIRMELSSMTAEKLKQLRRQKDEWYNASGEKGEGYFFFDAPMKDDRMKEKYGIAEGESGCDVMKRRISGIFTELKKLGVEVDYVYGDMELIENDIVRLRNRHRLEVQNNYLEEGMTYQQQWNDMWNSRRFQREIVPELMKRGFQVTDESDPLITVRNANQSEEYNGYPQFGLRMNWVKDRDRRNANIFNAVAKNYTQSLFKEYVLDPVREVYPDAKCSHWNNADSAGWYNQASIMETYLGGSVFLGEGLYSCQAAYGGHSYGRLKKSMDNRYAYPTEYTGFTAMQNDVNRIRNGMMSGNDKIHPFVCCKYFFTKEGSGKTAYEYYAEQLLHIGMLRPDRMIAYFYYLETYPAEKEEYYRASCTALQDALDELNEVLGEDTEKKPLTNDLLFETDPFVLSGMRTKTADVYRLTPDLYRNGSVDKSLLETISLGNITEGGKTGPAFKIGGKRIWFPGGRIIEPSKNSPCGYWISVPARTEIRIDTDQDAFRNNPSYGEDFEGMEIGEHPFYLDTKKRIDDNLTTFTVQQDGGNKVLQATRGAVYFANMFDLTCFGDWAWQQTWEMKFRFSRMPEGNNLAEGLDLMSGGGINQRITVTKGGNVKYGTGKGTVISSQPLEAGRWYTIRRTLDLRNMKEMQYIVSRADMDAFLENNNAIDNVMILNDRDEVVAEKKDGELTFASSDYKMQTKFPVEYFIFMNNRETTENTMSLDDISLSISGVNMQAEMFRESDGVNLSRAKGVSTACDEKLLTKVSYVNASGSTSQQTVTVEEQDQDRTALRRHSIVDEKLKHGDEGNIYFRMEKLHRHCRYLVVTVTGEDGYEEKHTVDLTQGQPEEQVVIFDNVNGNVVTKKLTDGSFRTPARSTAEGAIIQYKSSDPSVATIDQKGEVSIKGIGETKITATAPAIDGYAEATAEYTLKVGKGDPEMQMGEDGTPFGKGASEQAVDKAITSMKKDKDPKGTVYRVLQAKSKKQGRKSVKVQWKKSAGAVKYLVYGNTCNTKGKVYRMMKLATTTGSSKNFTQIAGKKIKKGTYYKFMVVALDKNNNVISTSKMIHVATKGGKVGNHKSVKRVKPTVKAGYTLKVNKIKKFKVKVVKAKKHKIQNHRAIVWESSNANIATVRKGRVTAKKKGTCTIYAYAQNGVCTTFKITVE